MVTGQREQDGEVTQQCALCGENTSHLCLTFKSDEEVVKRWLCEQDADRLDRWWKRKQMLRRQKQSAASNGK